MSNNLVEQVLSEIDDLSYDILMCLRTGLPVSTINEYKLSSYLDGADMSVFSVAPHLRELSEYFLDNGIDGAWNIGNLLIGDIASLVSVGTYHSPYSGR